MTISTKPKQSLVGIELVRLLAYEGDRIFTTDRARELAPRVGLKDSYLGEALYHLRRNNWIVSLRRGLYGLSSTVPGVSDAHEFEVAMALVNPAAISHWSALHHHGLTEQVPREVFVLTTTASSVPRVRRSDAKLPQGGYPVGDTTYRFVQVRPERFFGTQKVWVGEARVSVTDVERTLLHVRDSLDSGVRRNDMIEIRREVCHSIERRTPEACESENVSFLRQAQFSLIRPTSPSGLGQPRSGRASRVRCLGCAPRPFPTAPTLSGRLLWGTLLSSNPT